jgi:hypothetical protein
MVELLRLAGISREPTQSSLLVHLVGGPKGFPFNGARVTSVSALLGPAGDPVLRKVIPVATDVEQVSAIAADECADPAFESTGATWDQSQMPVMWRFRARSVPKRLRKRTVLQDLRIAHRVWPRAESQCLNGNEASLRFRYAGRANKKVKPDGTNMIEMGRLGRGVVAATYQWMDGTRVIDSDIRLARGAGWATVTKPEAKRHFLVTSNERFKRHFIVANAVVHGVGNQVGLADLADPHDELSMYGVLTRGETKKVSLGTGDMLGAWLAHP